MKWGDVLLSWEKGKFSCPSERFEWNTSVYKNEDSEYKESFKVNLDLPTIQDATPFQQYFNKKYVVSFPSFSGDILVVPIPVKGKNYATLKDFTNNAPQKQQKAFWNKVVRIIKSSKEPVWVSVHGLGVSYTHVRIAKTPKYYFDKSLT
jgi:hypothetical protein